MREVPLCGKPGWGGHAGAGGNGFNLIRTSIYDKYSGSMKITTHLYHVSHCKTASGTTDEPTEYLSQILAAVQSPGRTGFFSGAVSESNMKRELNQNLSGNEVYYTACSLLVMLRIRVVNFIAGTVLIHFSFHMRSSVTASPSCAFEVRREG